jgi:hypothetical protein
MYLLYFASHKYTPTEVVPLHYLSNKHNSYKN